MPPADQIGNHPPATLILMTKTDGGETNVIVAAGGDGEACQIATIPVRELAPSFVVPECSITRMVALDVLEAVLDEEAWIAAMANVLAPGGTLTVRVPLEGPVAWLDALNLYRYTQDILGTGEKLQETTLKGWHRHYRPAEVGVMLECAGLVVDVARRDGNPLVEAVQFGGLVWGGVIRGDASAEESLRAWREEREDVQRLPALGPLSTRLTVTARKPR